MVEGESGEAVEVGGEVPVVLAVGVKDAGFGDGRWGGRHGLGNDGRVDLP